jgi:ADP-dependent phosphofructokinase/glucokinase
VAVAHSVLITGKIACDTTDIQYEDSQILATETFSTNENGPSRAFTPQDAVIEWTTDRFTCVIAPVPVCKAPVKTAGLGDNISGTGLAYHRLKSLNKK